MLDIMKSIYDMMGKYTYPTMQDDAPREHVESFFQVRSRPWNFHKPSYNIHGRGEAREGGKGTTERAIVLSKNSDVVQLRVIHQRLTAFFFSLFFFLLFQKMDRNKDGVVTVEEFIESCKKVRQDF